MTLKPSSRTLKPWVIGVTDWWDSNSPSETNGSRSVIDQSFWPVGCNYLDGELMRPLYFHYLFVISSRDTAKIHAFRKEKPGQNKGEVYL